MARVIRLAALVGIGCLTAFAASSSAQTGTAAPVAAQKTIKQEPVKSIPEVAGAATYREYCTACHGVSGHGNGPAASALKTAPADLTLISRRAGGTFPFTTVKSKIAGDDVIAAHGSREMPTWGPLFKQAESNSVAELRLTNLVKYIEDLQSK